MLNRVKCFVANCDTNLVSCTCRGRYILASEKVEITPFCGTSYCAVTGQEDRRVGSGLAPSSFSSLILRKKMPRIICSWNPVGGVAETFTPEAAHHIPRVYVGLYEQDPHNDHNGGTLVCKPRNANKCMLYLGYVLLRYVLIYIQEASFHFNLTFLQLNVIKMFTVL